jgi:hypothetical protein
VIDAWKSNPINGMRLLPPISRQTGPQSGNTVQPSARLGMGPSIDLPEGKLINCLIRVCIARSIRGALQYFILGIFSGVGRVHTLLCDFPSANTSLSQCKYDTGLVCNAFLIWFVIVSSGVAS